MNRIILILALSYLVLVVQAQDQISLEICYEKAIENYPLTVQGELLTASNELKMKSLNKNYMPQMLLNGQAHYQSDVTKMPIQEAAPFYVEPLSKDWYKVTLDVNQVIYDGSATSREKQLEQVNYEIRKQNLEVEFYNLKQRINSIYFTIILLSENEKVLELHKSTLQSRLKTVQSAVTNGTLLQSNEDILAAEIIKIEQSIDEISINRDAAIKILNEYTALNITGNTKLSLPDIQIEYSSLANNRPEYKLFSMEQRKIESSKKLMEVKNLPRLSAFGQAGYGRPGYDMLKNQFDDFYMLGARLSWNFYDWNHTKKEKEILNIQNDIIHSQKETFDKNVRIDLENKLSVIRRVEQLISRDQEIIELRTRISESASSQLSNGVITSTEYITELNEESSARLNFEIHAIELVKAKLEYQSTLGNI